MCIWLMSSRACTAVTPHPGFDVVITNGYIVVSMVYARQPERFIRGVPRPRTPAAEVWINPPENRSTIRRLELPRDTEFVPQLSQSH